MDNNENNEIWITDFSIEKSLEYRDKILKQATMFPELPIVLYINSYGGEAAALMNILDTLDSLDKPVITVASGTAMSCGAYLLMRGDNRYIGPNTSLMFHRVSSMTMGTDIDQLVQAEHSKRLTDQVLELTLSRLASRGSKRQDEANRAKLEDAMKSNVDFYISAKEALELGIVHKISVPRVVEQKMLILDRGMTEEDIPDPEEEIKPKKKVSKKRGKK